MDLTPDFKALFTRIFNLSDKNTLTYSNGKIRFNNFTYVRKNNEWYYLNSDDPYKEIGFIPYDIYCKDLEILEKKVEKLESQVNDLESRGQIKKPKYRSSSNYIKNESRIHTVMFDVSKMRFLTENTDMENNITEEEKDKWVDDFEERKLILKSLYENSIKKNTPRTKVYMNYKRLSVWESMYDKKFSKEPENTYSRFYIDLLEALKDENTDKKPYSVVTKFTTRIHNFTKLFSYLPPGSWATCNIPVTFYNLIYSEFWDVIFECIEKEKNFPYDEYFSEDVLTSKFSDLKLQKEVEEEELGSDQEDDLDE